MLDFGLRFHGFIYPTEDQADYFYFTLLYTSYIILRLSAYDAFYFQYLCDGFSNLTANESKIYRFYHYALPHGTCFKTVLSLQIFSSVFVMNRPHCCLMLFLKKHVVFFLNGSNSNLSVFLYTCQKLSRTMLHCVSQS